MKTAMVLLRVRRFPRNCACWFTRGFVGARKRILLFFVSSFAITSSAMIVFPIPVGSTTKVFAFDAEFAILY